MRVVHAHRKIFLEREVVVVLLIGDVRICGDNRHPNTYRVEVHRFVKECLIGFTRVYQIVDRKITLARKRRSV